MHGVISQEIKLYNIQIGFPFLENCKRLITKRLNAYFMQIASGRTVNFWWPTVVTAVALENRWSNV
jgi:hypothetical protein